LHTEERNRDKKQRFGTLDGVSVEKFDENNECSGHPRDFDLKNYGSLVEQSQHKEFGNIEEEIAEGNMTNRVAKVLPNSIIVN
tara:strand:- start:316 stop:564 length:249 start_codon:yes stop_codon:yes gene_type:complete